MKRIKTLTFAVAIMSCAAVNAAAEEPEFNAPDINGRLNTMVEAKMNALTRATYAQQVNTRVVEYTPCENSNLKPLIKESIAYDTEENRS